MTVRSLFVAVSPFCGCFGLRAFVRNLPYEQAGMSQPDSRHPTPSLVTVANWRICEENETRLSILFLKHVELCTKLLRFPKGRCVLAVSASRKRPCWLIRDTGEVLGFRPDLVPGLLSTRHS